jgi:ferredoxin
MPAPQTRQHDPAGPRIPALPDEHSAAPVRIARTTRRVRVSVDNNHCHLFGICQQEAPEVFDLGVDGRLRYPAHPDPASTAAVQQAARCCPMQAITLETR